jgi:hypothetical protein
MALDDGFKEAFLGTKMVLNCGDVPLIRGPSDLSERDAVKAFFREELLGRVLNFFARAQRHLLSSP